MLLETPMKFLEHRIGDKNFLRLIKRFLITGVMEEGKYLESETGTPQGVLCKALHNPPCAKKVIMQSNLLKY